MLQLMTDLVFPQSKDVLTQHQLILMQTQILMMELVFQQFMDVLIWIQKIIIQMLR